MGFAKHANDAGLPAVEDRIGHFDIQAIAEALPGGEAAVIADHYLTCGEPASSRIIRILRPIPPHFHRTCDEYVLILNGSGVIWLEDPRHQAPFRAGHLLFFASGVIHCVPRIFEGPVLAFSVDAPSRPADDVVYVDRRGDEITPKEAERRMRADHP